VPKSDQVLLDLNNPVFQEDLFNLEKAAAGRVFVALRKLKRLSWSEVHKDKGLRWELVQSKRGPGGMRLYTIRITDKIRALVCRDDQFMRFLSLHRDHDSAYR
jgi:hypothetical protein